MCLLEREHIRDNPAFQESCLRNRGRCCRSWSLGNYVALFSNKTSCLAIEESDVQRMLELLTSCSSYYHSFQLTPDCSDPEGVAPPDHCAEIPARCKVHNTAIYYIFHYILDMNFLERKGRNLDPTVKYAMTFLPMAAGIGTREIYKSMDNADLSTELTKIVAINFGVKHDLFDHYLKADIVWFGVAIGAVFLFIWMYTTSLFLTVMTLVCIGLSLGISYFLYSLVFEIKFFPFMNLLAVVLILGVGCDDMFIYCHVWMMAKSEKNAGTLEKIVSDTLRHATLSMFVTSFTTASALYANYVSNITALRCFAIFSGTVIMVNFFMVMTWIPAAMVIHEKWCSECCLCYSPDFHSSKKSCGYYMLYVPHKIYRALSEWARIFFEQILPCIIVKARVLWILLFGLLGLGGIIVVFYYPKLKLPSSNEFQMFEDSHPFEVYDFQVKDQFWFEKAAGSNMPNMPLAIVVGARPADKGNQLDPYSKGDVDYDSDFNLALPESQDFMLKFCRHLRSSHFYQLQPGLHLTNCYIESFKQFMRDRSCRAHDGGSYEPCCERKEFPFSENVFNQCINDWLPLLNQAANYYHVDPNAGLRYSKETGKLVAAVIKYTSNTPFSFNYNNMYAFYSGMDKWTKEQLQKAPDAIKSAWFVSDLDFFDLQNSIARGTPIAIGVSLAITMVMAFLTTLNVFITLYAVASIALAIFATVASLVLLGWQLNIMEAFTITVAIGLCIDFTLHYGMAYRLSPDLDREKRVVCATGRMGNPVAMAAFTTFLAGALMMPSTVLAYRQLGMFLMLVMTISWVYATFFFQSLLRAIGPQGGFGQLHWPSCDCCSSSGREHKDKTVYTMSESTMSSSSTNHVNSSETHELEPLTEAESISATPHQHHHHHHHHHHHNHHQTTSRNGRIHQKPLRQLSSESLDTPTISSCRNSLSISANSVTLPMTEAGDEMQDNLDEESAATSPVAGPEEEEDVSSCLLVQNGKDELLDSNRNSCSQDVIWVRQSDVV